MGLDLALGVVILISAFRGWFRGFITQAVRIGGLIACVYLADPVRDYAKPLVLPYLPSIPADLVDRVLWWVSAVLTYVVLVGAVTLVAKMTRRPEIPGLPESRRNDQFAGLLLGLVKGALIAVFMTAGIQRFALTHIQSMPWAEDQAKSSRAQMERAVSTRGENLEVATGHSFCQPHPAHGLAKPSGGCAGFR